MRFWVGYNGLKHVSGGFGRRPAIASLDGERESGGPEGNLYQGKYVK